MKDKDIPKVLYDDECELCKSSIRFIDEHKGRNKFDFIPLKSEEGKKYLEKFGYPPGYNDSVLLIHGDEQKKGSDAVLEILHKLKSPWSALYRLKVIPRPVREFFYGLVSKYRHRGMERRKEKGERRKGGGYKEKGER